MFGFWRKIVRWFVPLPAVSFNEMMAATIRDHPANIVQHNPFYRDFLKNGGKPGRHIVADKVFDHPSLVAEAEGTFLRQSGREPLWLAMKSSRELKDLLDAERRGQ